MDITAEELKQRMDAKEKLFVIDVREPYEYEEVNIGALNIPLGSIPMKMYDFDDKKDDEVIVHCKSGMRSATAKAILEQNGFKNVRNLIGGILEFKSKFPQ